MKKYKLISILAILLVSTSTMFGEKIHKSAVPSLIINNFNKQFPRASDVEWKMENDIYKVEFEVGLFKNDHTVWYDSYGNTMMHKAEISKRDLPKAINSTISTEFKGHRVSDVKRITKQTDTTYTMELKRFDEEWKVSIDSKGNIISKIPD